MYRVYTWCYENPPPCDSYDSNNNIVDSGNIDSTISSSVATENSAVGHVVSSTDPATAAPGQRFQITRMPGDQLALSLFPDATFCGPNAPQGACGA